MSMLRSMASADLLLHPIRLRIVRAFLGERALTTAELGAELGDVPHASLYRHVGLLAKAGVLQVVAERRVRAVTERTYMLRLHAAQIQPDEAAAMTPEQHLAAFMAYTAGMLADVERYLTTGAPEPLRDGASYRIGAVWLSDAELADLARDLAAVLRPRLANAPARGRRRRVIYTVVVPTPEPAPVSPKTATPGAASGSSRSAPRRASKPPASDTAARRKGRT